jgi:hypothetical protein
MKPLAIALTFIGLASSAANATADDAHGRLQPMPKSVEIRFALSALPPPLRADATVYLLDTRKGYVLERAGGNGQSCFVSRTEWKFADYRDDIYDATCYDAVGAKNHMKVLFDVAAMRAQGVPAEAMKKRVQQGFKAGTYHAPDSAGFSYMTAPLMRTYMSLDPNDKSSVMTMSMPHVMYYAPNVTDSKVGGLGCPPCAPYPFAFDSGPHGYIIQRLGDQEAAKIVADESTLVRELCDYQGVLCLQPQPSAKP